MARDTRFVIAVPDPNGSDSHNYELRQVQRHSSEIILQWKR
jgi:hypothetical protein